MAVEDTAVFADDDGGVYGISDETRTVKIDGAMGLWCSGAH